MTRTVVLALGNPLLADDGAGPAALARLPDLPGVEGIDGGTAGLALLARVRGVARLLVLDAVETGYPPGTVVRLEGADLAGLPGGEGVHRLGLPDLLAALELLGEAPGEVVLLGVQPGSLEPGLALTPEVERALPFLTRCAEEQLAAWGSGAGEVARGELPKPGRCCSVSRPG